MKLLMFFLIFKMTFLGQFLKFQSNLSISKNKRLFKYTHTHVCARSHTHTHTPTLQEIFRLLYWRTSKALFSTHNTLEVCCIIKMVRCICFLSLVYASCPNICACTLSRFSCVQVFVILWTLDCQDPLAMKILQARILEWFAMPSSRGIFPIQGPIPCLLCLLHWQVDSLPLSHMGSPALTHLVAKPNFVFQSITILTTNYIAIPNIFSCLFSRFVCTLNKKV